MANDSSVGGLERGQVSVTALVPHAPVQFSQHSWLCTEVAISVLAQKLYHWLYRTVMITPIISHTNSVIYHTVAATVGAIIETL